MEILPIVARELRVAARRNGVYRLRLAAGILTLGLGSYFLLLGDNLTSAVSAGRILFLIVSVLLFFGAVASAHESYDSISSEKREGTLGFLFLTELCPHDIVLGKLFAAALPSFYAMLATFPLLASAALMGGVTGAEIWRTCLALLNLFFFAHAAAILASSLFRERAHAATGALFLVAGFTVGLAIWAGAYHGDSWWLKALNPAYDFAVATQLGRAYGRSGDYWISLADVNAAAWIFLGLASLALPRSWYEKPAETSPHAPALELEPQETTTAKPRHRAPIGDHPFRWLAYRTTGGSSELWGIWGLVTLVIVCKLALQRMATPLNIILALAAPHVLLKYWMAAAASRSTEEQRRNGLFELLLGCTPLTDADVISGQRAALMRLFLGPTAALLLLDIMAACLTGSNVVRACLMGAAAQLPFDMLALAWMAMWFAVSQKKPRRAAACAYLLVCAAPSAFLCVPLGIALNNGTGLALTMAIWNVVGLSVDIAAFFLARQKLRLYLRAVASGAPEKARNLRLFAEPIDALAA